MSDPDLRGFPTKEDVLKFVEPPAIIMQLIAELASKKKEGYKLPEKLTEGGRNTNLYKLSAAFRAKGLEWDEISAAVHAVNENRSVGDKLEKSEVDTIIESACKYERGDAPPPLEDKTTNEFVICLGHAGNDYFFTSSSNRQIVKLSKGSFSTTTLLDLMPYEYWQRNFTTGAKGGGIDSNKAASFLMQRSREKGIFSLRNCRGRGLWKDRQRDIYHSGSVLTDIQSKRTWCLGRFETSYIYQLCESTEPPFGQISPSEFKPTELINLCRMFHWKKEQDPYLLAGWIALAQLSGSLSWKPHIWITGQKGTGKSTVIKDFIKPLLGPNSFFFEGDTTPAGIRQHVGCDALPIIFDEAETSDDRSGRRMQGVIELARQSSSDNEAYIVKGTPDGKGFHYKMSSMFCMGSIRVGLSQEQDRSRFCTLELLPPIEGDWPKVEKMLVGLCEGSGRAVFEAMLLNIGLLRRVIKVFEDEIAGEYSRRMGNQYGSLLAGYFVATFGRDPTAEEVGHLLSKLDLEEMAEEESETDSMECLNTILQSVIRVEENTSTITCTIFEAIQKSKNGGIAAETALGLYGIAVDATGRIFVSNKNPQLEKLLGDCPWGHGRWAKSLARLPGALAQRRRINSPYGLRCVMITSDFCVV